MNSTNISEKIQQQIVDILKVFLKKNDDIKSTRANLNEWIDRAQFKITIPLYLIAPSGYAETEKLEAAANFLKNFNLNLIIENKNWHIKFNTLEPRLTEISNRRHQRFGGDFSERIADFKFKNIPKYAMVMPVRGGYGFSEILPHLDWQSIQHTIETQKLFILGYSDFTLFHLSYLQQQFTQKTSTHDLSPHITPSFLGPMFASDFYYQPQPSNYTTLSLIFQYLKYQLSDFLKEKNIPQKNTLYLKKYQKNEPQNLDDDGCYKNNINCQPYDNEFNHTSSNTLKLLQAKIWGGNLAMLCHAIGTPAFLEPAYYQNQILILEDIGEAPYAIDRMLYQLYYAGILSAQKAVILGQFSNYKTTDYDNGFNLNTVFDKWQTILNQKGIELLTGLNFGHTYHKQTLIMGADYEIYYQVDIENEL